MKVHPVPTRPTRPKAPDRAAAGVRGARATARRGMLAAAAIFLVALAALPARAQYQISDASASAPTFGSLISVPGLERFWISGVGADRGLGYRGSYFSAGGLLPLTADVFDGTWFVDGRGHVTADQGRFFSNIGLGRRSYFDRSNAIFGASIWYDYDGDDFEGFGHSFNQIGTTGEVFTDYFDFRINGYWPVGRANYKLSPDCFYQHSILVLNGLDTALRGFDAKFSLRPQFLGPLNGYIDIGGYAFRSQIVDSFGGVTTGFGVSPLPGVAINMEINHDSVFATTGFVRLAFGLGGTPGNSRTQNRVLEPTRRNDHIVRFNQQPVVATNPGTGLPWNVVMVDNTNSGAQNGTAEHPYDTLAEAQANSAPDDIIFVRRGDGTARGMDAGITLQDRQQFLGDGTLHRIPTVEVGIFEFCDASGDGPVIRNVLGPAVTLANENVVAGFTIDHGNSGIFGSGITGTLIRDNNIIDVNTNAILLQNVGGPVEVVSNFITNPGTDGVQMDNFTGDARIENNTITLAGRDGIHTMTSDGTFRIRDNTVADSTRDAVQLFDTIGTAIIESNSLTDSGVGNGSGIRVDNVFGFLFAQVRNNYIVTNGTGISMEVAGVGSQLDAIIERNQQISSSQGDGIQMAARGGGTTVFTILDNPIVNSNGLPLGAGEAIRLVTQDGNMNGLIERNSMIDNAGQPNTLVDQAAGIRGIFVGNSNVDLTLRANIVNQLSTLAGSQLPFGDGILLNYDITNTNIQRLILDNNQILQSEGIGVFITASGNTVLDATLHNNTIFGSTNDALRFVTSENALAQLTATRNNITQNNSPTSPSIIGDETVNLFSFGNSRLIGLFTDNNISINGQFGNPGMTDVSGLSAASFSTSTIALLLVNNNISNNGDHAVRLRANGSSTQIALLRQNVMKNNQGLSDVNAIIPITATPAATICLELIRNVSTQGYLMQNPGGGTFAFESDGLNTGTIDAGPGVLQVPLGTCATLGAPAFMFP